jgi:hypothetical protein
MNPERKVKVVSDGGGSVTTSVSYYAEADPRILAIFKRYCEGKADEKAVYKAVEKIAGQRRLSQDWKEEAKAPEGSWVRGPQVFEEWVAKQPPAHCRIYGSPKVIAHVIIQSKESA